MLKRFFALFLLVVLLPLPAQARWGLNGKLLELAVETGDYELYTSLCSQVGNVAALRGSYHNELLMEEDGKLKTFTGALFQPGESYEGWPTLTSDGAKFTITYHENLWYSFERTDSRHRLTNAQFDGTSVKLSDDGSYYIFTDETGASVVFRRGIWLEHFNVELFPKTLDEVRHLSWMLASLDGGQYLLGTSNTLMKFTKELSKASVFTAPYIDDALRAANGHATVSFKGDVWQLRTWRNEYGGEYYVIRYDISPRQQRIGYIRRTHIDGVGADPWSDSHALNARVVTLRKTVLTDDPDISQTPVLTVSKGARLRCLGTYDDNFAYVATVDSIGRTVWGFVPLRDLTMLSDSLYDPEPEIMADLEGVWWFENGDDKLADLLTLRADGTYEGFLFFSATYSSGQPSCTGKWYVTKYDPAASLYWNDPVYEITFIGDDGTVMVDGLTYTNDTLYTSNPSNGNTYRKVQGG